MPAKVKPSYLNCSRGQKCDVLFFGESPGAVEAQKGCAFVGPAGKTLRRVIAVEMPDAPVVLDNACPEYLNGDKPNKAVLDKWAQYRADSIKKHKPKVIVLLGEHAFKAFALKGRPVKSCGNVTTVDGLKFVQSIHPSYATRNPNNLHLFLRVFCSVRSCVAPKKQAKIIRVDTLGGLRGLLDYTAKKLCGFDVETTTAIHPGPDNDIACCSIACENEAWWIPLMHPETWSGKSKRMLDLIIDWWSKGPRIVQNLKMELGWMRHLGAADPPQIYDTMLQAWIIDEESPNNLNHLVTSVLEEPPYWTALDEFDKSEGYGKVPIDVLGYYNAHDSRVLLPLHEIQRQELGPDRAKVCDEIIIPLAMALETMERNGMHVDTKKLSTLIKKTEKKAKSLVHKTEKDYGVNTNSSQQMSELLFKTWGLKPVKKTSKGAWSTDKDVLEILASEEPRLAGLDKSRKLNSLVSRIRPWLEHADKKGLIHTNFNVGNVVTIRLSSSNPNLQNIDRGGPQRKCITSRFGRDGRIIQADYKQHELRICAVVAGVQALKDSFARGEDAHQNTADMITKEYNTPIDRSTGKNCNFALIYDITEYGLYEKYRIALDQGRVLIPAWHGVHPEIRAFHKARRREMKTHGYVENIFGVRRHVNRPQDRHQCRQAYNAVIQCPAVLICYLALIEVNRWLIDNRMKSKLILQIHDSVVLDAHPKEIKICERELPGLMKGVDYRRFCGDRLQEDIPIDVDIKVGRYLE